MSVGAKILGLVSTILVLFMIPTALGMIQMSRSGRELAALVEGDLSMRASVARVAETQLRQAEIAGHTLHGEERSRGQAIHERLDAEIDRRLDQVADHVRERLATAEGSEQQRRAEGMAEALTSLRSAHEAYSQTLDAVFSRPNNGEQLHVELRTHVAELEQRVEALHGAADGLTNATREQLLAEQRRAVIGIGVMAGLACVLGLGLGIGLVRRITRPLTLAVRAAERVASGDADVRIPRGDRSELGQLLEATRVLVDNHRRIVEQARVIAAGDYTSDIEPRGDKDQLGHALREMTRALREAEALGAKERWVKTGQAELADVLRGGQDLATLSRRALEYLARYVGAAVGALYVDDHDGGVALTATYAFAPPDESRRRIELGDGPVGQAARDGQRTVVSPVAPDYLAVTSALGSVEVRHLVVQPLRQDEVVVGVLELGTVDDVDEAALELLLAVSENIAIALNAARSRDRMTELLAKTQRQERELRAGNEELEQQAQGLKQSQEELRAANEELEEQTRLLRYSEEELQAANEELEEKTEFLKRKHAEVAEAENALRQKAAELEQASKYKSEFLANMSHELRTPLNSLLILAKSLSENTDGNLTAEQIKAADVIYRGGLDLLHLINDILDLSKVEAGKLTLRFETARVDALFDTIRRQFTHVAADKGLGFEASIAPGVPVAIRTDVDRVEQVMRNLLSNAFKFTAQGVVSMSARVDGSMLLLSVADTGIGVSEEQQSLIFEAFQQADGSTNRRFGGTGLGLTISREMAGLLGGELRLLRSTPGEGSVFALALPLDEAALATTPLDATSVSWTEPPPVPAASTAPSPSSSPPVPTTTAAPPAPPDGSRPAPAQPDEPLAPPPIADDRGDLGTGERVVLVIEDDLTFAEIVMGRCRERGFKCLVAASGTEGIRIAHQYCPTAIILDVGLPDIGGVGVLEQLKYDLATRHIPVHIISAGEVDAATLAKGAIGFVRKPATTEAIDEVLVRLEQVVSSRIKELLVVEDNPDSATAIRELVAHDRLEITSVESGTRALELLGSRRFDCMVLDLVLPDMTGFALLERAREAALGLPPVVVYTGKELSRDEHRALTEYAASIVIKGANSPERLLDETSLFLHSVNESLPASQRRLIRSLHDPDAVLRGRRVLLVDDDLRNTFALSSVLGRSGLTVVMADNGQLALDKLATDEPFDCVIMDVMMPVMDGLEAMRRIRDQPRFEALPIIALTAKAMPDDRAKCFEAGANDYLTKPVDVDKLTSLLRVWLFGRAS